MGMHLGSLSFRSGRAGTPDRNLRGYHLSGDKQHRLGEETEDALGTACGRALTQLHTSTKSFLWCHCEARLQ